MELIEDFETLAAPNHRYASFDYCFNYFDTHRQTAAAPEKIENSCMHLGAYLASWGMFRGSSFLLKTKSMRHFRKVVEVIASDDSAPLWNIDCNGYDLENVELLLQAYRRIRDAVIPNRESELILVTKIMLAVFACVPAFDGQFTSTLRKYADLQGQRCGFWTFDRSALLCLSRFYNLHREVIDETSMRTRTFDFTTGERLGTNPTYKRAKIMDMIGFQANGEVVEP